MGKITIDNKVYDFKDGGSVNLGNGVINIGDDDVNIINSKNSKTIKVNSPNANIVIEGNVTNLKTDASVNVKGNVTNIEASGSVNVIGDVIGKILAKGSVIVSGILEKK